jgi:glutamate transport system substrate-binding protein
VAITRKGLAVAVATLLCVLSSTSCDRSSKNDKNDSDWLSGPITIGGKNDQPGFNLQAEHTNRGFEVDLANYLGDQLGFEPTWTDVPSNQRENVLINGNSRLVVATYSITPTREKKVDFAGPYLVTYQTLLVRDDSKIKERKDVHHINVCTADGSTTQKSDLPEDVAVHSGLDYDSCVHELLSKKTDAVLTDEVILYGFTQQHKGLRVLRDTSFGYANYYGVGLQKGHHSDCERVVNALRSFLKDKWATYFRTQLPAIVEAHPADWENRYKPDPNTLDQYSCKQ